MIQNENDFTVNQWGTPAITEVKRKSKYAARMEVVKARNLQDPDVWGVVGALTNESSARSRASMLRKEYPRFEAVAVADENQPGLWLLWARWGQGKSAGEKKEKKNG